MSYRISALAVALALTFAPVAFAQVVMTEAEVRAALYNAGYNRLSDLEFEDGMWETEATRADGARVDLRFDTRTGQIYVTPFESAYVHPPVGTPLTVNEIQAAMFAAGFTNVHDLRFGNGVWKAEADDRTGDDVEVQIDPYTGRVISVEDD